MYGLAKNAYKWYRAKREENRQLTVMLIGLDGAGKTTVLSDFKGDKNPYIAPTVGFSKPLKMKRGKFFVTVYDLGGGPRIRGVWANYFSDVHGAIFVVDAADEKRLAESKKELVASFQHPLLAGKPILILANKQDLPSALAEVDISERMGLNELTSCRHSVVKCVASPEKNGGEIDERVFEGLNWLLRAVETDYSKLHARVKEDQAEAKAERERRRAAQKERVAGYKQEREAAKAGAAAAAGDAGATESKEAGGGGSVAVDVKAAAPAADPDVILCCTCNVTPATGRCAASKWLAVCAACREGLEAGEEPAALAAAAAARAGGTTPGGDAGAAGGAGAGATAAPAAAAEEEEDDPYVVKCSQCKKKPATKKSGKLGWAPVCDDCDPGVDEPTESEPDAAEGGVAAAAGGSASADGSAEAGAAADASAAGAGDGAGADAAASGGAGGDDAAAAVASGARPVPAAVPPDSAPGATEGGTGAGAGAEEGTGVADVDTAPLKDGVMVDGEAAGRADGVPAERDPGSPAGLPGALGSPAKAGRHGSLPPLDAGPAMPAI